MEILAPVKCLDKVIEVEYAKLCNSIFFKKQYAKNVIRTLSPTNYDYSIPIIVIGCTSYIFHQLFEKKISLDNEEIHPRLCDLLKYNKKYDLNAEFHTKNIGKFLLIFKNLFPDQNPFKMLSLSYTNNPKTGNILYSSYITYKNVSPLVIVDLINSFHIVVSLAINEPKSDYTMCVIEALAYFYSINKYKKIVIDVLEKNIIIKNANNLSPISTLRLQEDENIRNADNTFRQLLFQHFPYLANIL